jgi:hypothetical protein
LAFYSRLQFLASTLSHEANFAGWRRIIILLPEIISNKAAKTS